MEEILEKIKEEVKELFKKVKDPCHDFNHILRVYNLSEKINKEEKGDSLVIGASALLHDLHHFLSEKKSLIYKYRMYPLVSSCFCSE